jgi:hypothetical protein
MVTGASAIDRLIFRLPPDAPLYQSVKMDQALFDKAPAYKVPRPGTKMRMEEADGSIAISYWEALYPLHGNIVCRIQYGCRTGPAPHAVALEIAGSSHPEWR